MPNGKKRKRKKISTHKRKKRRRANRHKKKNRQFLKIAVVSDTHIPARLQTLPGIVYEHCSDVDLILHSGDLEDVSVLRDLERLAPVKAVKGNMDRLDLPLFLNLKLKSKTICISHGSGTYHDVRLRLYKKFIQLKPDIIIHGHTHEFYWQKNKNIWFLCPGAISNPIGYRSMALLTLEDNQEPIVEKITF